MSINIALLIFLQFVISVCNGRTAMKYFASKYCPDGDFKIAHMDVFYLVWEGEVRPNLCKFTFISGYKTFKICFESEIFKIHYLAKGVGVKVTHGTKSAWNYNKNNSSIPHTCVREADKLVFSIVVPYGYREPSSRKYIELRVDAEKHPDDEEDLNASVPSTILGFIAFVILAALLSKKSNVGVGALCRCCIDVTCYFVTCKCLPECDPPSCDCSLVSSICQPCQACYDCCSACLGCSPPREEVNEMPEESTAMTGVSTDQPQNTSISTSASGGMTRSGLTRSSSGYSPPSYESAATEQGTEISDVALTMDQPGDALESGIPRNVSSNGSTEHPPPSYETAARDMTVAIYQEPLLPPPNYEEVMARM